MGKSGAPPENPPTEGGGKYSVFLLVFTGFPLTYVPIYIIMGLTQRKDTMTLARFLNYILYTDKKPDTISSRRWCAMKTSAEKNFKKV
jgi:hypothetical protein